MVGAVLAAGSNLLFALLATIGNDITVLMVVISADNLSAGIASAAFVAYLSSLTSTSFTASQYALFSSIMVLLPKILAGYSGVMVESVGYEMFFIGTAAMGLPVLVLIYFVAISDRTV
jgi:PAT family beta-lactamase induction signal transducer AmpG